MWDGTLSVMTAPPMIVTATPDDVAVVRDLLRESASRLAARGIDQWRPPVREACFDGVGTIRLFERAAAP